MRTLVFILLTLALLPLFLLGLIVYTWRVRRISIPRGLSGTANEPYGGRLMMHIAGTRPDPAAYALAGHLPVYNRLTTLLFVDLMRIPLRISGYRDGFFAYPGPRPSTKGTVMAHRTAFFDEVVHDALTRNENPARQFVVLGAGFDTRCFDLPEGTQVRCFEVDMPPTLAAKQKGIRNAGIAHDHVTFVDTDFDQKSWLDALVESGFDTSLTTFILWEGVTMYLNEEAVTDVLRAVASLAPGSSIAFDYFSKQLIDCEPPFEKMGKAAVKGIRYYGESWSYGIDTRKPAREPAADLVGNCGLTLTRFEHDGIEEPPKQPMYCFALAERQG